MCVHGDSLSQRFLIYKICPCLLVKYAQWYRIQQNPLVISVTGLNIKAFQLNCLYLFRPNINFDQFGQRSEINPG